MPDILLVVVNAKWIHPSLALRLLKANLGPLENRCHIMEFALRQPLREKVEPILAARPRILGISVSIWNHAATLELLQELERAWESDRPVVVLGGPEVSYLPDEAPVFRHAGCVIRGEGEPAFRELCEHILEGTARAESPPRFITAEPVNVSEIKSGYRLYTGEDLRGKLVYVEASRGCPFQCEFCLSAVQPPGIAVREFPLERFLAEMDDLISRGARNFKFLDRTFNLHIDRSRRIMEFFVEQIKRRRPEPLTVHFEMVPSRFPPELRETLTRFPPGSLRLEIGIQTFNRAVAAHISRPADPEQELETLRFLRDHTSAVIHADLIAALPGEDLASFGRGFDRLWDALAPPRGRVEIQPGILKLLPGAPIARRTREFGMRYSPAPPYEALETAAMPARDLDRVKNFARFWELIVNRSRAAPEWNPVFNRFLVLSDNLLARFGRNWGIDRNDLWKALQELRYDSL